MARHLNRRGLSGIWTGVLVIILLLLTSAFTMTALDYLDKATTASLNAVKRAGESCSIIKSITGYWTYNETSSTVTITLTNYYLETVTIVSLGFIVNTTSGFQHIVIDRFNAASYGITLPNPIPPGSAITMNITLPGRPVTVSVGVWGSSLAVLAIPPGGVNAAGPIIPPQSPLPRLELSIVENHTIYYSDMQSYPTQTVGENGQWSLDPNAGYWVTGDGALVATITGGEPASLIFGVDLRGYTVFYIYTKIRLSKLTPNENAGVTITGDQDWSTAYNITFSKDSLIISNRLTGTNQTSIKADSEAWYALLVAVEGDRVTARLYSVDTGSLQSEVSLSWSMPEILPIYFGFIANTTHRKAIYAYYDEILVSTRNPVNVTFTGVDPGWTVTLMYQNSSINSSTSTGSTVNVTVIGDTVTGVNGNSTISVTTPTGTYNVTSTIPILGGNTYQVKIEGVPASFLKPVGLASSSR